MEVNLQKTKFRTFKIYKLKEFIKSNFIILLALTTIFTFFISFSIGFYNIPVRDVVKILLNPIFHFKDVTWSSQMETIIWNIRMPRIIAALIVGASLSVSGSSYQCMFKNPLVSPDILGVSAGAGLGAAIAISFGLPYYLTQLLAFTFGIAVVFLSYLVSIKVRTGQTISLVLAGTLFGTLCTSTTSLLKYVADPTDKLPNITFFLMGSLAKVQYKDLIISILPMIIGFFILYSVRYKLNILTLDDEEAASLGINPIRLRLITILASTLLTASSVCVAGLVGWIGLLIPHITRMFTGPNYQKLLPASLLLGGAFLLIVDNLARSLATMEIPLGIITSILGAPFLLRLIMNNRGDRF